MKSKKLEWTARSIAVLVVLAVSTGALAQNWEHKDKKFTGLINAYTPQTTSTTGAIVGPYEIRGPWTLKLKRGGTKADFSAALNMEFSDGWVLSQPVKDFDPTLRNAHTHHITLADADVTQTATGFQVTGLAAFTLSGNPAPPAVSPSMVVIEITGGTVVQYSNITITLQPPGSNHFGTAPLPGVVQSVQEESVRDR